MKRRKLRGAPKPLACRRMTPIIDDVAKNLPEHLARTFKQLVLLLDDGDRHIDESPGIVLDC